MPFKMTMQLKYCITAFALIIGTAGINAQILSILFLMPFQLLRTHILVF